MNNIKNANLRTINGVKKTNGLTNIKIKIYEIEEKVDVYIIDEENFKYYFLIGLDIIKKFKLIQNEQLKITQNNNLNQKKKIEEKKENTKITDIEENNFQTKIDYLTNNQKYEINKLIENNKSIFANDKYDIGTVREYEARIDLTVDKYCSKRPYRCSVEDKKEIEEQISKLLEKKLIKVSYSPFAAPVTLAFKKEDKRRSRLCIDFRDLNKIVVPQAQPFPLIDDLVIKTRNCNYFSTLDINSSFWSIPLRMEDRKKLRL